MAGIYLHIPFCNKKCIYCGFYSVASKAFRDKYIPALEREISHRRDFFASLYPSDRTVKTLYIGGGTPSVLSADVLGRAVSSIRDNFSFPSEAFRTDNPDIFEFTVEVNPDDITPGYAQALKELGANRISMGVQSFNDSHLEWMGRRHNSQQAEDAFKILRNAGFSNISLDLIFGFPMLSQEQWEENLDRIIGLHPEHISAYQLGIDPDTPLERLAEKGRFRLPEEEVCEKMYKSLQAVLKGSGYTQYEVSNFCSPGFHSRHNSSYWSRIPYLGLGPGAHSFIGRHREWNYPGIETYCNPDTKEIREGENLSPEDVFNEILMLGLRTAEGVRMKDLRNSDPMSSVFITKIIPVIQDLEQKGLLAVTRDGRIKIPSGRLFVSDGIIRDLFV